jgi:hypothetical protein
MSIFRDALKITGLVDPVTHVLRSMSEMDPEDLNGLEICIPGNGGMHVHVHDHDQEHDRDAAGILRLVKAMGLQGSKVSQTLYESTASRSRMRRLAIHWNEMAYCSGGVSLTWYVPEGTEPPAEIVA